MALLDTDPDPYPVKVLDPDPNKEYTDPHTGYKDLDQLIKKVGTNLGSGTLEERYGRYKPEII